MKRSPMKRRVVNTGPIAPRILARAVPAGDCLLWTGKTMVNGYAVISWRNKRWLVHRAIWTETVGPIPGDLTIDHLCRNRTCVNVAHMEVVTRGENSRRGGGLPAAWAKYRARTHCKHGHEFTDENTRYDKDGRRICRTCSRASWRAWAERKGIRKPLSETRGSGHGTRHAYETKGCRCAECVASHEALLAGRRRPRRTATDRTHGRRSTYVAGCRCEPCRSANTSYARTKRRDTGPSRETVMAVLHRDGYRCVCCGGPIVGERGRDWSIQHRLPRSAGGGNGPENLLSVLGNGVTGCHGRMESRRTEAYDNGWLVRRGFDPATVAVLVDRGSRWVLLSLDGRYLDPSEEAA